MRDRRARSLPGGVSRLSRVAGHRWAQLVAVALGAMVWSGCAHHPPPLPGVTPSQLPAAWLSELAAAPCAPGLEARLRMRVRVPGEPGVRVDGTLKARLPDSLKVTARLGVFRPLFVLHAQADSCLLLVHEEKAYWISARDDLDWERMNPSAWTRALGWALCPQSLAQTLEPRDGGRMEGRNWVIEGDVPGQRGRVRLRVDPRSRSVVAIELWDRDLLARAELREYRFLDTVWLPTRIELEVPQSEGRLEMQIELLGLQTLGPGGLGEIPLLRPPGWFGAHPGRVPVLHVSPP